MVEVVCTSSDVVSAAGSGGDTQRLVEGAWRRRPAMASTRSTCLVVETVDEPVVGAGGNQHVGDEGWPAGASGRTRPARRSKTSPRRDGPSRRWERRAGARPRVRRRTRGSRPDRRAAAAAPRSPGPGSGRAVLPARRACPGHGGMATPRPAGHLHRGSPGTPAWRWGCGHMKDHRLQRSPCSTDLQQEAVAGPRPPWRRRPPAWSNRPAPPARPEPPGRRGPACGTLRGWAGALRDRASAAVSWS